jgi:hypothetical protein
MINSTENASRSQYKTSVLEESSLKITKNASILHSPDKVECLAPYVSHVRKAGSHVTHQTLNITRGI